MQLGLRTIELVLGRKRQILSIYSKGSLLKPGAGLRVEVTEVDHMSSTVEKPRRLGLADHIHSPQFNVF